MNTLRQPGSPEAGAKNRIMVMTGVAGSGKDYLIGRAVATSLMPEHIHRFSFGQDLFKQAQVTYPALRTRDDLRTMLTQAQVEAEASSVIKRLIEAQPALVNTHVAYRQGDSLAINPAVPEKLQARHYVYVKAEPTQIVEWRSCDTSRVRPAETVSQNWSAPRDCPRSSTCYSPAYRCRNDNNQ